MNPWKRMRLGKINELRDKNTRKSKIRNDNMTLYMLPYSALKYETDRVKDTEKVILMIQMSQNSESPNIRITIWRYKKIKKEN